MEKKKPVTTTEEDVIIIEANGEENTSGDELAFERVNFDDISTIYSYGANVQEESTKLLDILKPYLANEERIKDTVSLVNLQKLSQINAWAEEEDKKKLKAQAKEDKLSLALITSGTTKSGEPTTIAKVAKFVRHGVNSLLKVPGHEFDEVETYGDLTELSTNCLNGMKEEFVEDIQKFIGKNKMTANYLKSMNKIIDLLKLVVKIGYEDKDNYEKQNIPSMEAEYKKTQDPELGYKLSAAKSVIALFGTRLSAINEHLTFCIGTAGQVHQLGVVTCEQIMNLQQNIQTTLPALSVQMTTMISARMQHDQLVRQRRFKEGSKVIFHQTSAAVNKNMNDAAALIVQGPIDKETFEEMGANIQAGLNTLVEAIEKRNKGIIEGKKILDTIQQGIEKSSETLSRLSGANMMGQISEENLISGAIGSLTKKR